MEKKIFPAFDEFERLAADYSYVPICREIVADLDTPLTLYHKLALKEDFSFLLESLEGGERWGRYSFIGYRPALLFCQRHQEVEIIRGERRDVVKTADPLPEIARIMKLMRPAPVPGLPDFYGGAVGFFSFETVKAFEKIPHTVDCDVDGADAWFMVPEILLVHDNLRHKISLVRLVEVGEGGGEPEKTAALYRDALLDLDEVVQRIRQPLNWVAPTPATGPLSFESNMSQAEFLRMVERAVKYVEAGDLIQVVLSQRFQCLQKLDPVAIYRALRLINPSPYLFHFNFNGERLIGSSPELLVRKNGSRVAVRPIAGTRPRGADPEADQRLAEELLADPKEVAEHIMLVDLGRNDIGRVSAYGQVLVEELMKVERYSHVMHIVSHVEGKLRPGLDMFDTFRACYPAGTVSGAPKVRALEIIDELEPTRRGPYAGAVGYFGFSGDMDFAITIRTVTVNDGISYFQAGAGIVADSNPEMEYQETLNKASAMRRALELAAKGW
ncbi:MAG: anthranilate synthase component I [Deltaproteobacteria bacterium]|nr:anthranilate synthase component I [Deltaproteobacteria bacterium]